MLEQLGRADASITELAERFDMTLTGMKKHVGVLEQAGLVTTEKSAAVRTCRLGGRGLEEEAAWIERIARCGPPASTSWTQSWKHSNRRRKPMDNRASESAG